MVRAWCIPRCLYFLFDRSRLLGQHVESHVMFNAQVARLRGRKAGWQNHPQTKQFDNNPSQLIYVHDSCVLEMKRRGYKHNSPMSPLSSPFKFTFFEFVRDVITLLYRRYFK